MEFKGRIFFHQCVDAGVHAHPAEFRDAGIPERPGEQQRGIGPQLMDHHMGAGASATMPGHEDKMPFGNRPNGIYIRASAM